jgi:hypothetical protein
MPNQNKLRGNVTKMNLNQVKTFTLLLLMSFNIIAKEQSIELLDILMDTPPGFTKADNFNGFVQPESFATLRMSEINQSFTATSDSFLQNVSEIISRENVTISDRQGLLVKHKKTVSGNAFEQWTLLFGDNISTITIIASYPLHLNKGLSPVLKNSLLSTRWLRLPSQQLFQGLPFVLDQSDNLTIVKRTFNSVVLIDKAPYDNSKAMTPLFVVSSVTNETEIIDIIEFSKAKLADDRFKGEITIDSEKELKINGIRSYHIEASAIEKNTGLGVMLYQTIAFQPYKYLFTIGVVEKRQAAHFKPQFEAIVSSLKFKNVQ